MRSCTALVIWLLLTAVLSAQDWPQFRGPGTAGTAAVRGIPTTWDAKKNIVWQTALPGPGTSSPVLFGRRAYLTCYTGFGIDAKAPGDPANLRRHLLCIDTSDGRLVWDRATTPQTPEPGYGGFLALHGYASSTPAVDADGVYVYYGASGLLAYSHDGQVKWRQSCGQRHAEDWGSATSPVIYRDLVIVHADVESETIFAFDRKTGREVWKRSFKPTSNDAQHTRSTPLVMNRPGGDLLIIHSRMNWVSALDPATGTMRWEYEGTKDYQNPSPVTDGELIYVLTYQKAVALRPDGAEAWTSRTGSEIVTPIVHEGHLYWANEEGMAFCLEAKTGKSVYQERLNSGRIYASGVLAEGRLYYVSREQGTYVVAAAPQFELIAENKIAGDPSVFNATPALAEGRIYLRSDRALYCIGAR